MLLNYKEAVEEFGPWIADMMVQEEYNQYLRGYVSEVFENRIIPRTDGTIKHDSYEFK